MEDVYHAYLDCCSNKGDQFCQPELSSLETAKEEALQLQKADKQAH